MRKPIIALTTSAALLLCGSIVATAQQTPGTESPGAPQSPMTQQSPSTQQGPATQQNPAAQQNPAGPKVEQQSGEQGTAQERMQRRLRRAERDEDEDSYRGDCHRHGRRMMDLYGHRYEDEDRDRDDYRWHGGRMMGPYGHGMMGSNDVWRSRRGEPERGVSLPGPLGPMIFALIDTDGDGTISHQEWQTAHERIFRAMDTDKDGTVSLEEMQQFMRAVRRPASRP